MTKRSMQVCFFALMLAYAAILLRVAWIGDDAFITLRTVDNFVNGYGLTWNAGERVQAFTHPLWLFLMTGFYLVTRDPYFSALILSLLVSLCVMALFLLNVNGDELDLVIAFTALVFSNAFVEYSTSGLENPATHLILLAFALIFLRAEKPYPDSKIFTLALLAGLETLNRMDMALFFIPPLIVVLRSRFNARSVGYIVLGFAPFILWEIFSVIYYGFPFPNTFYAKLNTDLPLRSTFVQGGLYYLDSLIWDPMTLIVIGAALFISIKEQMYRPLAMGIVLYLIYILWIGGDFMSYRFFSGVFVVSALMFIQYIKTAEKRTRFAFMALLILLAASTPLTSLNVPTFRKARTDYVSGISNEAAFYYPFTGLIYWGRYHPLPDQNQEWIVLGKQMKEKGRGVEVAKAIGYLGYYAGPDVYIVDPIALADPLLARLPASLSKNWRVGHYIRDIPDGYIKTLKSGNNEFADTNLGEFYGHLRLIVRGPLWSGERWLAIWKMNTGQYNDLIEKP